MRIRMKYNTDNLCQSAQRILSGMMHGDMLPGVTISESSDDPRGLTLRGPDKGKEIVMRFKSEVKATASAKILSGLLTAKLLPGATTRRDVSRVIRLIKEDSNGK